MLNFKDLFKLAKEKGIEEFQISFSEDDSTSISVEESRVTSLTISKSSYISAKGIYNGKMGRYSTEVISKSEFNTIVDKVIESAKTITSEDEVFIYEGDKKYKKIKDCFNKELKEIPLKDKINLCLDTSKILEVKKDVAVTEVEYDEEERHYLMQNSKGLKLTSHENYGSFGPYISVNRDDDTRIGYAQYESNDFSKFDKEALINETYDMASSSIGAKPVESGEYEVVLSEYATAILIGIFQGMFSSDNVQKNISILKGKEGEKIGSSALTIVDDPFLLHSSSSSSFDTDGVATKYKVLVKNGVLQGFLYNLKTAKKDGVSSTGNARGDNCSPINLYIKPGKKSKDELIKEIKNGLLITSLQGGHAGANPYSGDFSLQATGYKIIDGKISSPVALVTVSSNILELFKNVTAVSNTLKNGLDSPAIKVKKVAVAGL